MSQGLAGAAGGIQGWQAALHWRGHGSRRQRPGGRVTGLLATLLLSRFLDGGQRLVEPRVLGGLQLGQRSSHLVRQILTQTTNTNNKTQRNGHVGEFLGYRKNHFCKVSVSHLTASVTRACSTRSHVNR